MFTTKHFLWLFLCAVCIGVGLFFSVRKKLSVRGTAKVMFLISLLSEGSKMYTNIAMTDGGGYILLPNALPLHLCSLLLFVVPVIAFSSNEALRAKAASFAAPVGLLGGIAASLIPTNGVDFCTPEAYQCFVYHAGLIWFALSLILTKQVDLGFAAYKRNIVIMCLLLLGSVYVNSILSVYDTNFLYSSRPPMDGLPVLNLNHGWFCYIGVLTAIGITLITAVHLPFITVRNKKV